MSHELIPADNNQRDDDESAKQSQEQGQGRAKSSHSGRTRGKHIPTAEEIYAQMAAVPGMVALKLITPTQGNTILRALQLLAGYRTTQSAAPAFTADANLINLLCSQPELLEQYAPLLTDEQIAMVMKGVRDDSQSEA